MQFYFENETPAYYFKYGVMPFVTNTQDQAEKLLACFESLFTKPASSEIQCPFCLKKLDTSIELQNHIEYNIRNQTCPETSFNPQNDVLMISDCAFFINGNVIKMLERSVTQNVFRGKET